LKVKVDAVADLVIVGFNYGKGKYKNMIGSISCESADGSIQVDVSGFADDFRRFAVELIDGWIDKGQVMEVKFNDIVQNANTQVKSLFLPRFVRLSEKVGRESADTLERIEDILAEFSLPLADK
jgi:ATP-dependent DNA ligase